MKARAQAQVLYVVLDGLGDDPCSELGGLTPLAAADIPVLNALAREGTTFRLDMCDRDGHVSTSYGQFSLLGYGDDPVLPQRGPVEAAGIGLELQEGDIACRANYATFDDEGRILDRRAGRIRSGAAALSHALDGLSLGDGVTALMRSGTEHRAALVLRGAGLGSCVTDADPLHTIREPTPPLRVVACDPTDAASVRTAEKLRSFLNRARDILATHPANLARIADGLAPANGVLTRRAGPHIPLPSLEDRFGVRCLAIAGGSTVTGVMRVLGCETIGAPRFTANVDTDVEGKFETALGALAEGYDVVLVHIKAVDILSHDRKPQEAARFLERVDRALGATLPYLSDHLLVAVAADHSTSSETGDHTASPPPALLCGPGVMPDEAMAFNELELIRCGAPVLRGPAFFRRILDALEVAPIAQSAREYRP